MMLKESVAHCLEGLLLVTNGSKGHKLVWYYDCRQEKQDADMTISTISHKIPEEEEPLAKMEKARTLELFHGLDMMFVADMLSPKIGLCDKRFQLTLDQVTYIGHPVTVIQDDSHVEQRAVLSMSLFHIVFLLHSTQQLLLDAMYQRIIKPLSMALRHEQSRCGYVRNEVETILSIYESEASGEQPQTRLCQLSELVRELTAIADMLKKKQDIHIRIHHWIQFNASLDSIELPETPIHPYQTILLTEPVSDVIQSLPEDTSSLLVKFLQHINPRKRYAEREQPISL
jgi:hypothetical protein